MKDVIYVNGNRLPKKLPPKVYIALNKPKGFAANAEHYSLFWNILLGYFSPFFWHKLMLKILTGTFALLGRKSLNPCWSCLTTIWRCWYVPYIHTWPTECHSLLINHLCTLSSLYISLKENTHSLVHMSMEGPCLVLCNLKDFPRHVMYLQRLLYWELRVLIKSVTYSTSVHFCKLRKK